MWHQYWLMHVTHLFDLVSPFFLLNPVLLCRCQLLSLMLSWAISTSLDAHCVLQLQAQGRMLHAEINVMTVRCPGVLSKHPGICSSPDGGKLWASVLWPARERSRGHTPPPSLCNGWNAHHSPTLTRRHTYCKRLLMKQWWITRSTERFKSEPTNNDTKTQL